MRNKFATILKQLRDDAGLLQKELADKIDTTQRVMSYWESGENEPDLDSLIKIAEFFSVSADYLLGLEE